MNHSIHANFYYDRSCNLLFDSTLLLLINHAKDSTLILAFIQPPDIFGEHLVLFFHWLINYYESLSNTHKYRHEAVNICLDSCTYGFISFRYEKEDTMSHNKFMTTEVEPIHKVHKCLLFMKLDIGTCLKYTRYSFLQQLFNKSWARWLEHLCMNRKCDHLGLTLRKQSDTLSSAIRFHFITQMFMIIEAWVKCWWGSIVNGGKN